MVNRKYALKRITASAWIRVCFNGRRGKTVLQINTRRYPYSRGHGSDNYNSNIELQQQINYVIGHTQLLFYLTGRVHTESKQLL